MVNVLCDIMMLRTKQTNKNKKGLNSKNRVGMTPFSKMILEVEELLIGSSHCTCFFKKTINILMFITFPYGDVST